MGTTATSTATNPAGHHGQSLGGMLARMREAIGTVYGDIGTSVLYTVMELTRETVLLKNHDRTYKEVQALLEKGGDLISRTEALGSLSLVFWALIFVTIKYDLIIMRADNRGEGGAFALWALLKGYSGKIVGLSFIGYLVVTAAGLLAADGMITPSISLLSAYEPLSTFNPTWPVIATLVSLFLLFKPQWRGTSKVGGLFGWFMMFVWFPWIALKGLPWMLRHPEVFLAFNPLYALDFLLHFSGRGTFVILGLVVLAITGAEAKYADIGHFARKSDRDVPEGESLDPRDSGSRPVMYSWFCVVLPCLLINYAGQVGRLLEHGVPPRANTFYSLTPRTGEPSIDAIIQTADMVISAIAAFIASQALITGMFSIIKQAMALGFTPRYLVRYTSKETEGQVYLPGVNWAMFAGCVTITLGFQNSSNLAAAYGIAVTGTMVITTIVFGYVAHYRWNWSLARTLTVCSMLLSIDVLFFGSNLLKFTHGGYVPMVIALALVTIMLTWQWGRSQFARAFYEFGVRDGKQISWLVALRDMLDEVQASIEENLPLAKILVQGRRRLVETDRAAVFLCSRPIQSLDDYVPVSLRIFLKKYGVLPAHITLLHVYQLPVPIGDRAKRYKVQELGHNIIAVTVTYGYMEQPDVRGALRELQRRGEVNIPSERWIVEVGEEEIITDPNLTFLQWIRIQLFRWVLKLSTPAHKYLGLGYDAGISKEVIPVIFAREGTTVKLPELEITDPDDAAKAALA